MRGAGRGIKRCGRWGRQVAAMAVVAVLGVVTACVDAPNISSPTSGDEPQSEPLAETFDAMSRASAQSGDLARSDGFTHAALAVRGGVTPSRLEVQIGTTSEVYDAIVTSALWDSVLSPMVRPPARRTLVGWRRGDAGKTRVVVLTAPNDSAAVLSPLSLGMGTSTAAVFAAASAMQQEVAGTGGGYGDFGTAWYATSGWVKLREFAVLGSCADSARVVNQLGIARCEETRYLVRFDLAMQRLTGRPPQEVPGVQPQREWSVGEPVVNGVRIRFACVAPRGDKGCR